MNENDFILACNLLVKYVPSQWTFIKASYFNLFSNNNENSTSGYLRCRENSIIQSNDNMILHYFKFDLVYSQTYQVPMLMIMATDEDGQPITMEELLQDLNAEDEKYMNHGEPFLTQQDHPFLNIPYFCLHPCKTSELMQTVLGSVMNNYTPLYYLLSWLSLISPFVHLHLQPVQLYSKILEAERLKVNRDDDNSIKVL